MFCCAVGNCCRRWISNIVGFLTWPVTVKVVVGPPGHAASAATGPRVNKTAANRRPRRFIAKPRGETWGGEPAADTGLGQTRAIYFIEYRASIGAKAWLWRPPPARQAINIDHSEIAWLARPCRMPSRRRVQRAALLSRT